MRRKNNFLWFAVISILFSLFFLLAVTTLFWQELTPGEKLLFLEFFKKHAGFIFGAAVFVLAMAGLGLDWIFRIYILPISKLADEATLITSVNPSHRISFGEGSREILRLALKINEIADRFENEHRAAEQRITMATEKLLEEKYILTKVIAEVPVGVLVTNADCRILLYNMKAKDLIMGENTSYQRSLLKDRFIGLGRSILGVLDKNLVAHVLDDIEKKLCNNEKGISSSLIMHAPGGRLVKCDVLPVMDDERLMIGLIFLLLDITDEIESVRMAEELFNKTGRSIRGKLSGIRSIAEAMIDYPDMEQEKLNQFKRILLDDTVAIGKIIDDSFKTYSASFGLSRPLISIDSSDLVMVVKKRAKEELDMTIEVEQVTDEDIWIRVDSYSIVRLFIFLAERIKKGSNESKVRCSVKRINSYVAFDLSFLGPSFTEEEIRKWDERMLPTKEGTLPLTFGEVRFLHKAEVWSYPKGNNRSGLKLVMPADTKKRLPIKYEPAISGRPEYFDMDLFESFGQSSRFDDSILSELTCTVFDTETTGLSPERDEIISIGAVRIVNGKLRKEDIFDQLIDPMMTVPFESIKIHGIRNEDLKDQPSIKDVLPRFASFCEDTVLVAHNAAFDLKMLSVKEKETGISFKNPVLDTLLLSAFIHPHHTDHSIEAVAERLGIRIIGRHTALGDALATAEIFLKMIPLLSENGIFTLKDAQQASRQTYYARLKY